MKPNAVARVLLTMVGVAWLLPQTAAAQTTHMVTVGDNFFSPANLTIQVGDTVQWNNAAGGNQHNVTGNGFASSTASSFTFSETFNSAGTFNYGCTIHSNMDGTITVQSGGGGSADLAMQSVDAQNGTYAPGDDISVDVSVENIGNAASGGYTVTAYASTNSTINSSDTEIGSSSRPALAAGQTSNFSVNAAFPDSIGDGSYFIGAIIEINDANNANNDGVDNTTVTIESPPPPPAAELVLTGVSVTPGSYAQGSAISISADVENPGSSASGAFSIDFYASTNSGITVQDRLLGTQNRASLQAGAGSGVTFNTSIPGNLAPGSYFIGAIVNFNDSNSGNNINVNSTPITVTASGGGGFEINYGVNDTWFNPATAGQGFFITVFPDIQKMFLAWFTYDVTRPPGSVTAQLGEPGHRWLTAFGDYSGDTATLDIEITEGGIFDSATPVPTQGPDGTITVTFTGCNEGEVSYNIPSISESGVVPIERIALDNVPTCEAQQSP